MIRNQKQSKKSIQAKRVVMIGLLAVIVLSLLSMVASAVIFKTIFRRMGEDPFALKMEYSAADAEKYPRESIGFSSGNHTVRGNLYGAENKNGIILVVNGFGADCGSHLAEIFYFLDAGWTVLTFDGTGVGNSDGNSMIGLEQVRRDVLAALEYVSGSERFSGMPVFLYGHSAGGYAVSTVCDDERVCATVSISGFDSPCALMKYYGEKYAGFFADMGYPFMYVYDRILFGEDGNESAHTHIAASGRPVLIIQGNEDETVPYEQSIYAACLSDPENRAVLSLVSEPYRNRHSSVWLRADAAEEYFRMQQLSASVQSEEVLRENAEASDEILRQTETEFLEEISAFFAQAAAG